MRTKRLRIVFLATLSFFLAACGGGGGPDGPSGPPSTTQPPPPSSSSGVEAVPKAALDAVRAAAVATTTLPEPVPNGPGMKVTINDNQQFIGLGLTTSGKIYAFSKPGVGIVLVDPATIDKLCFNSFETGWEVGGKRSRACAPVSVRTNEFNERFGYAELPQFATCNRARGTWSLHLKDSSVLWPDTVTSDRRVAVEGLPVIYHTSQTDPFYGLIDYGQGGRIQPTITAAPDGQGGTNLVMHFGSNCLSGFGQDGQLADLRWGIDRKTTFRFAFNCKTCGEGGLDGWGSKKVLNPDGSVRRNPSIQVSYDIGFDSTVGEHTLTFRGLKCSMKGSITVYRGTIENPDVANSPITWDDGTDAKGEVGYGLGWLAIQQNTSEFQLWVPTGPVSFNRQTYQIELAQSACGSSTAAST